MSHHKKQKWDRNIPDSILLIKGRRYGSIPSAESLHPSIYTTERAIAGDMAARLIIDSWQFACPVREVAL